jgi:hypothetical protein
MSVESLTALIVAITALLGHVPTLIGLIQHLRQPAATAHPVGAHKAGLPPEPPAI